MDKYFWYPTFGILLDVAFRRILVNTHGGDFCLWIEQNKDFGTNGAW
jgi:hypothetical protein